MVGRDIVAARGRVRALSAERRHPGAPRRHRWLARPPLRGGDRSRHPVRRPQRHPRGPVQRRPRPLPEEKGGSTAARADAEPLLSGLRRRGARRRRRARCRCRRPRRPASCPTTPPCRRRSSTGSRSATSARRRTRRAPSPPGYLAALIASPSATTSASSPTSATARIYRDTPPPGAWSRGAAGADPERVLVFQSLSKRSNAPGLRVGFAAGGPRDDRGPAPAPRLRRRAAALADPARGDRALERRGARRREPRALPREVRARRPRARQPARLPAPQGGFFLWLRVGDGEAAALRLYRETGVRVLPGGYLGRATPGAAIPARTTSAWRLSPRRRGRARPRRDPRDAAAKRSAEERVR